MDARRRAGRRRGAIAFADSSIVVLALPELFVDFETTIPGVSFVVTAYNLVVAAGAFLFLPLARRYSPARLVLIGLLVFGAASIGCAAAGDLPTLIASRAVQGLGAVLLLVGRLAARSPRPSDWRAIFIVQAPVAFMALPATARRFQTDVPSEQPTKASSPAPAANTALGLLFGALVGALFLGVLLLVAVWGLSPIEGAAVVSALPIGTVIARLLGAQVEDRLATIAGALLLALGLGGLALLPSTQVIYAALALLLCGCGLGLAIPPLSQASISVEHGLVRSGAWTVGARHVGLVAALILIAPLLAWELDRGGQQATLAAAAEILDAPVPLTEKVPLALDLKDEFEQTPRGQVPDLNAAFAEHTTDGPQSVVELQESLLGTIEDVLTRSFRTSFVLSALFALLAVVPMLFMRRRRREASRGGVISNREPAVS